MTGEIEIQARKDRLRTDLLIRRQALDPAARAAAGVAIAQRGLAEWRGLATVAAYSSMGSEPSTRRLLDDLTAAGVRVLLPVVDGERLDWAAYTGAGDLTAGRLGIAEPTGPRLSPRALADAELVIVPALAVDRAGIRLGRGGGYYDRALADVTTSTVAIVYDTELLDHVPAEPHDHRIDAVLRPAGLSSLS